MKKIMMNNNLLERTKRFSLKVIELCEHLPNTILGRIIGGQLIRSGTSVGSNYRAVCRARSRAEFNSKMSIVIEEADESAFWLEIIKEKKLVIKDLVAPLLAEANEIVAIMVKSRKTSCSNK